MATSERLTSAGADEWGFDRATAGPEPYAVSQQAAEIGANWLAEDRFASDVYYNRLSRVVGFELRSGLGRLFGFLPQLARTKEYLNIGCGAAPHPDFTNLDFYALRTKLSLLLKGISFVQHDLRYPLPFRDGIRA